MAVGLKEPQIQRTGKIANSSLIKILLADDDKATREVFTADLKKIGFELVGTCRKSDEIVKKVCRLEPDVILMDLFMPGLDGLKATCKVQELCPTPVVMLSSVDTAEYGHRAAEAGASAFLTKPLKLADLKRTVHLAIARHHDMVDLKQTRQALEDSEEKFKVLSEKSGVGVFIIEDGLFSYLNVSFAETFGYQVKELTGKKLSRLITPEFQEKISSKISGILINRIKYTQFQFQGLKKNNAVIDLEMFLTIINIKNKPCISGTLIDITKKIRSQQKLKEKSAELENLNQELEQRIKKTLDKYRQHEQILMQQSKLVAMGEMVGAIAHQWRQPLTTVNLIFQNIRMAARLNKLDSDNLENWTSEAMKQIEFMSQTIDDFRNYFKPSKEKQVFLVSDALDQAISIIQVQLKNNFISVKKNYPFSSRLKVLGYLNEFKQVIINIFNNAANAIKEGRVQGILSPEQGDIFIDLDIFENIILLKIANNGISIPADKLDRIFEPYFTSWREGKGMGIGLYMSKTIIETQMDGHIQVENKDKLVVFTIILKKAGE